MAVRERELEELRLGDRIGRARLDAQVTVDATEIVDLVDEAVALTGAHGRVDGVVLAAHVDATGRAHARAQLASDALLHAVLVAVQDVATMEPDGLRPLLLRIFDRDDAAVFTAVEELAEGDGESVQIAHLCPFHRFEVTPALRGTHRRAQ